MVGPDPLDLARRVYRRFLVPALLLTVAANVVTSFIIPPHTRPVVSHSAGDLGTLVDEDAFSVRVRFGIYEDLRGVAAGSTFVAPLGSFVDGRVARDLAEVTVEFRDYDPAVGDDIAASPRGLEGDLWIGSELLDDEVVTARYWFVAGPAADTYWLATHEGDYLIVPGSVAPAPGGDGGG